MNKAPLTDHDLGIPHGAFSNEAKFRDIRKKAKLDEEDRHKKFKRSKKKDKEKIPKYKIGEEVVLASGFSKRHYCLAEVIDFEPQGDNFTYFGIMRRTTDPDRMDRIGRLMTFESHSWWSSRHYEAANVENKGIHWLLDDRTI